MLALLFTEDSTTAQNLGQLFLSTGISASFLLIGVTVVPSVPTSGGFI